MKKCLLFDNDGTLVDSERLCNVAMAMKFQELGIDLDADALVIRFRGWKLARILDLLAVLCRICRDTSQTMKTDCRLQQHLSSLPA